MKKSLFLWFLFSVTVGILFVPPIHELFHAIAVWITGGTVVAFRWASVDYYGANNDVVKIAGPYGTIMLFGFLATIFSWKNHIKSFCSWVWMCISMIGVKGSTDLTYYPIEVAEDLMILPRYIICIVTIFTMTSIIANILNNRRANQEPAALPLSKARPTT